MIRSKAALTAALDAAHPIDRAVYHALQTSDRHVPRNEVYRLLHPSCRAKVGAALDRLCEAGAVRVIDGCVTTVAHARHWHRDSHAATIPDIAMAGYYHG